MTILMGMAIYPIDAKPYALMVADSMSTQLTYNFDKISGEYEVSEHNIKENVQKLHKFGKNLIIGFEGELRGDIHHKVINSLSTIIELDDDLHVINRKIVNQIKNSYPDIQLSDAQYSVLMAGFIDGIPSINKVVFINKQVVENVLQKPDIGNFSMVFDTSVTKEMAADFNHKTKNYNNISTFRKALVNLAKETSKLDIGSNDIISIERLR